MFDRALMNGNPVCDQRKHNRAIARTRTPPLGCDCLWRSVSETYECSGRAAERCGDTAFCDVRALVSGMLGISGPKRRGASLPAALLHMFGFAANLEPWTSLGLTLHH